MILLCWKENDTKQDGKGGEDEKGCHSLWVITNLFLVLRETESMKKLQQYGYLTKEGVSDGRVLLEAGAAAIEQ